MNARYTDAYSEIAGILAARTQAEPLLDAKDVWRQLTCWPLPSPRSVRRYMERIRKQRIGHRGQTLRSDAA